MDHDQPVNMDVILNRMRKQVEDDFDSGKDLIFGSLVENKASFCNQIPEELFVNYFLPLFLGEKEGGRQWMVEWVGIAGTPSAEVAVVDRNRNILFFVPPMVNNSIISDEKGTKYGMILDRYNLENDSSPYKGILFMEREFNKKSKQVIDQEYNLMTATYQHQWDFIRMKYRGVKPVAGTANQHIDNSLNDLLAE